MKLEKLANEILSEASRYGRKAVIEPVDIDPENRSITSKVTYVPDFAKLLDDAKQLEDTMKYIMVQPQLEGDTDFEAIFKDVQYIKNKIRSHIRKKYRREYEALKLR
jgi:hypothetical protein